MRVSLWSPSGDKALCFRVEARVVAELAIWPDCTAPSWHWREWLGLGAILSALKPPGQLFLVFVVHTHSILVLFLDIVIPCGMKKKSVMVGYYFPPSVQSIYTTKVIHCCKRQTGSTSWQCGAMKLIVSLYSQSVRVGTFFHAVKFPELFLLPVFNNQNCSSWYVFL